MARKSTRTRRNGGSPRKSRKRARTARTDADAIAQDISGLAASVGAKGKAQLAALSALAQSRAHGAFENFEHQVRAKPALTLGAAVGVGVVAGLLLARRH